MHILGAPHTAGTTPGVAAYQAFPLKGAVGRCRQDRGLTVALRICEDLESFEATTSIEVTSPARPWLGAVQLADNGDLHWQCDYRAAFHGDPAAMADVIAPILRAALLIPARIRHGRPIRLLVRAIIAAVLCLLLLHLVPGQPSGPAVVTGLITWFVLTGRGDLAPPPGR